MAAAIMKHMASNFAKLDKFERVNFKRWQKKMHFLLFSMSVMYVLTTPIPEDGGDDATVEQIRKRAKWDNEDYVCRGLILNGIIFALERVPHGAGVSNKPKGNNVDGPLVVNMIENNNSTRYNDNKGKRKHHDNTRADFSKKAKPTCWKCGKTGHNKRDCKGVNVGNKANAYFVQDDDVAWCVDSGETIHVCKDRCWFKTYESLNDGSILHMGNESTALVHGRGCVNLRDDIFDENSSRIIPLDQVLRFLKWILKAIGGSVVPEDVTEEVVQDEISDQHSYCFNVEDDPKTFNEAMKSKDVAFWKEAIDDEMDSIMGNNTWVLVDLSPGCKPLGCKWIFKRKLKVDGTIEKFKARLVIQLFRQNAATLAKAYSQIYNGKVRHLGVRHSMIHELITNGVVSIEFVKSQQNLADNLMKGLARDLL
ncbi:zinc finger, CCHC-type containing protein [Tanacetum coccineum]